MKKLLFVLIFASFLLNSCTEEDVFLSAEDSKQFQHTVKDISGYAGGFQFEDATKSSINNDGEFVWETGNKLGFWPSQSDMNYGTPSQVIFDVIEGGKSSAKFRGNGWGLVKGGKYYAYYPYDSYSGYDKISINYTGQKQSKNNDTKHLGDFDFLQSVVNVPENGSDASAFFTHLGAVSKIVVSVPDDYRDINFCKLILDSQNCSPSAIFANYAKFNPSSDNVLESIVGSEVHSTSFELSLNGATGICPEDGKLTLYFINSPILWKDLNIRVLLVSSIGQYLEGELHPKKNQESGHAYNYSVTVNESEITNENVVDLGLSVNWRTCNLGAESSTDPGYYIAWGELEEKEDALYKLSHYKYYDNNSESFTKYCNSDSQLKLSSEDDAAVAMLGGGWRIPTYDEWKELVDTVNCSWEWQGNGYLVTSKKPGFTDRSIFLPAGGHASSEGGYSPYCKNTTTGCYWSSELEKDSNYGRPCYIWFMSNGIACGYLTGIKGSGVSVTYLQEGRYSGFNIRPVCSGIVENIPLSGISLNKTNLSMFPNSSAQLSVCFSPMNATNKSVIWSSIDENIVTVNANGLVSAKGIGSTKIRVAANNGSIIDECEVFVSDFVSVDLGLSVEWATSNVGAADIESYGNYYSWAETEPKSTYTQDTYKYYYSVLSEYTKYNDDDHLTTLDDSDDAATANMGSNWRIPTKGEWEELKENCSWVKQGKGYLITSKKSGFTNKSIFLPAAGFRTTSGLCDEGDLLYWSSSLKTIYIPTAYCLQLDPYANSISVTAYSRSEGYPVRAVHK